MYTVPRVSWIRNWNAFLQQGIDQRHRHVRLLRDHDAWNTWNRLTRYLLLLAIKKQPAMVFDCFRILRHHINDTHCYPSQQNVFVIASLCHKKNPPFEKKRRKIKKYRKRYGLHAMIMKNKVVKPINLVSIPQAVWIACNSKRKALCRLLTSFNTASGMDCMQCRNTIQKGEFLCFNTASGMDCMQWKFLNLLASRTRVSIPQAVWIACNRSSRPHGRGGTLVSIPQAIWIACNKQKNDS